MSEPEDPTVDPVVLEAFHEETTERLDGMVKTLLKLEDEPATPAAIDELFRDTHSIKGSACMVGLGAAHDIAHTMEDVLDEVRSSGSLPSTLVDPLLRATDALRSAIAGESGVADAAIVALRAAQSSAAEVEKPPAAAGSTPKAKKKPKAKKAKTTAKKRAPAPGPDGEQEAIPVRKAEDYSSTIRVGTEKVDRMLDAVGETVLHHRQLEHALVETDTGTHEEDVEEALRRGELLLDDLQDAVIQMRTLPLSSITGPYPRAVRDLAAAAGKKVELEISGADTQLDRVILDGISETILHVLRNAIAHGIEPPPERRAAGKPESGQIELRAEQRSGVVAIEIIDDGCGVSAEVLQQARQASSLTDLLTQPGFSTAEEVTDVAGRGVGLDAVKTHIKSLGGTIYIQSSADSGMTVALTLPLTLELLNVLLVERDRRVFGLPLASVVEAISVVDTSTLSGQATIELRGHSVPLSDLTAVLGFTAPELPEKPPALIIGFSGRKIALACDGLLGELEVVVKSLGPILGTIDGYLGAAILGDGRISLILDPSALVKRDARQAVSAPIAQTPPETPHVLIVDDQFTVRELQRSILEAAGYQVQTARDGIEALDCVSSDETIKLVVTDIKMPEMDGFELLEKIRSDPERSSLPVVVVTSKGSDEDKRRGIDSGADAYIIKDEFDQQALLETVGHLIG